jgi:cyclopropane fatty-acyl-phospholipid synthase-like methyltransferase
MNRVDLTQESKVLDFGCGDGGFASALGEATGAEVFGFEPASELRNIAKNIGLQILPSPIGAFDLIIMRGVLQYLIMRGVLQYLENPFERIQELSKELRGNGSAFAILMTPDRDSLQYRRFGTMPVIANEEEWIRSVPSSKMLVKQFTESGYKVRKQRKMSTYLSSPYARPIHDLGSFLKASMVDRNWKLNLQSRNPIMRAWPGNIFNLVATAS